MKKTLLLISLPLFSLSCIAEETPQDMSDPLAVYTQAGFGITDKGINLKVGQTYDTGNADTAAMNIIELKGIGGELLNLRNLDDYPSVDDSIDSFRFRNFSANMKNGSGHQIDMSYDVETETLSSSYSIIQALPKMGIFSFFPLAGAGVTIQNDQTGVNGYSIPGTFALVGMYAKAQLTDKIWINYNPMYMSALSGSNNYKESAYGNGNSDILTHEFAISYQINPRSNIRYFANWSEYTDISKGDHRIEYNYQF
ncbi:hypothetical protein [Aliivibrio fischeri]|nr:hypothetical protein [Aliivibrio fischeri]EHN68269.1 putative lipoprotein [Aliivibrio fischeri SR5]